MNSATKRGWCSSVVAALASTMCHAQPAQRAVDILITGATVYDGTGQPARRADIGIRADRIVFVGPASATLRAVRRIDATGLIAAPGFIDPHTHAYEGLPDLDSTARRNIPALMQGVTTVVLGADGRGPLDVTRVLDASDRAGLGTNVYAMAGFGTARIQVLGASAAAATRVQIDAMRALITQAMREGAYGVGSGLFYAPQSYASTY